MAILSLALRGPKMVLFCLSPRDTGEIPIEIFALLAHYEVQIGTLLSVDSYQSTLHNILADQKSHAAV
jgi:hypothetical protein